MQRILRQKNLHKNLQSYPIICPEQRQNKITQKPAILPYSKPRILRQNNLHKNLQYYPIVSPECLGKNLQTNLQT